MAEGILEDKLIDRAFEQYEKEKDILLENKRDSLRKDVDFCIALLEKYNFYQSKSGSYIYRNPLKREVGYIGRWANIDTFVRLKNEAEIENEESSIVTFKKRLSELVVGYIRKDVSDYL